MIRARVRKDGTPAYSFVMRTAKAYEKCRRAYISSHYKVFKSNSDPTRHRNWKHYVRAARAVADKNVTPEQYMETIFVNSTKTSYPRPSNLYSKANKDKVDRMSGEEKEISLIPINELWAENLMARPAMKGIRLDALVLIPWVNFSSWFRVYYGRIPNINRKYATEAKETITEEFLEAISFAGYDKEKLLSKIEEVLNE